MKLYKKHIFTIVILIIIVILGIFSYNYYRRLKEPIAPVINAIPADAIMIAEFNNIYNLWNTKNNSNEIWMALQKISLFEKAQRDLNFINTIINLNEEIKQIVSTQKSYISLHLIANGSTGFLYLCNVPVAFETEQINEMLKETGIKDIKKEKKDNYTLYNVSTPSTTYYYTIQQGVFMGSVQKELVEKAVDQLKNGTPVSKDENFMNISSTAGKKVDANIYINYKYLSSWFDKLGNPANILNLSFIKEFAKWTELDLIIKNNQLLLNGYTSSGNSFLEIFRNEPPQENNIASILPEKTIAFTNINFSNYATYYSHYKNYLKNNNQLINYEKELNKLNLKVKFNLRDNFTEWMGKSYAVVVIKNDTYSQDNVFVICNAYNNQVSDSCLKAIASASQTSANSETANKIQLPGLLKMLLGNICPSYNEIWFETTNDFVIFGNSKQALSLYKDAIIKGELLAGSKDYMAFSSSISNQSNIYTYFNFDYAAGFVKNSLNPLNLNNFDNTFTVLQGFHKASLQFSYTDNRFFTTLNLGFKTNDSLLNAATTQPQEISDGSETQLDNTVINQPYLVKNTSDNEKNILVFDVSNKLYCIDKNGSIKWKINIDGKPLSQISEVDYLKNNKIQYLFNTANSIYLIDSKGNNIENYPVKLSKNATSGLCLIDYEKKRDYRILIPTMDKKINYFNIKGKQMNDFKSPVAKDMIDSPPQHLIFGGKDNIIISDKSGNFMILDRKGKERIKIKSPFHKNALSKFYYDGKYLLTTDLSNNIKYISSKGEVETKSFKNIKGNAQFIYEDFNNDGIRDYIFITSNELNVCKKNGNIIFSYPFKTAVYTNALFFENTGRGKLMAVLGTDKQLYVFNKEGLMDESIAFKGETLPVISVFNDKKQLNLITTFGNKLLKYTFQ